MTVLGPRARADQIWQLDLDPPARVCLTASGALVHRGKILLMFHPKLRLWIPPGGHLEPGETPHQAVLREFKEETGLDVRLTKHGFFPSAARSTYLPVPLVISLHWVCRPNYFARRADPDNYQPSALWSKGCEQHLDMHFLVELAELAELTEPAADHPQPTTAEGHQLAWVSRDEVDGLETEPELRAEIRHAFEAATQQLNNSTT